MEQGEQRNKGNSENKGTRVKGNRVTRATGQQGEQGNRGKRVIRGTRLKGE